MNKLVSMFFLVLGTVSSANAATVSFDCECTYKSDCYVLPAQFELKMDADTLVASVGGKPLVIAERSGNYDDIVIGGVTYLNHAPHAVKWQKSPAPGKVGPQFYYLLTMKSLLTRGEGFVKIIGRYPGAQIFSDSATCKASR